MFEKGRLIVYGTTGVCRISDISKGDDGRLYYVLSPTYDDCTIYAPVNGRVFMRPVMSKEEAESLIDALPGMEPETCFHSARIQELSQRYKAVIDTHDCRELARLIKTLYEKKQAALKQKRRLGQIDERFMRQAEELLNGELAAALHKERGEIPEYIKERIEANAV